MEQIELQVKARPNGTPAKLRGSGFIPAIIYGHNISSSNLAVPYAVFEKIFKKAGESTIISLDVDGTRHNVIIQDVQRHFLNGKYLHIDFYEVSMTEKMTAEVPLEFIGVSKAVKEAGGVLVQVLNSVEVKCLPADLPNHIEVDISTLNTFSDVIHVSDLKPGKGVEILAEAVETVVKVDAPRDVEKELAEPVVEDVSKVVGAAEIPVGEEGADAADSGKDKEKPSKEKEE